MRGFHRSVSRSTTLVLSAVAIVIALAPPASAVPAYDFATPVFGLSAGPNGTLFAADAGAGPVRLGATAHLVTELPGVTDVAPLKDGRMWATTSDKANHSLYRIIDREPHLIANLGRFEKQVNPDQGAIDSNPFDLAKLGAGQVLVADAAANARIIVDHGDINWVATFPQQDVPTDNAKTLTGCPNPPPDLADICDLPPQMPAEAVPTSVAVGPDGAYYVTELTGFPAPVGGSRIWRVEPGTRHEPCEDVAASPCSVVASGFTSGIDLNFGPDDVAHLVELDEASWFALEANDGAGAVGGTIDSCNSSTWACSEEATDLTIPMAVAIDATGSEFVVVSALVPGQAQVMQLP